MISVKPPPRSIDLDRLRPADGHPDAHVNIGRLAAVRSDHKAARNHYLAALASSPGHALAWFNLGVSYEDARRPRDAIDAYNAAIQADPVLADAHYNLSRLLEASDASGAFRHLSTYRRLTVG